jgi:hypothetical protein
MARAVTQAVHPRTLSGKQDRLAQRPMDQQVRIGFSQGHHRVKPALPHLTKEPQMTRNDLMSAGLTRRQTLLAMLSATGLSATGLTACGGGSDLASVGVGGTGSFTSGRITGFGSIIVNGIRYDDSSADISSDDNRFDRANLRLGMVVAVQGGPVVDGRSTATRIVLNGELLGPIGSKNGNILVVLGQTVTISDSTVFAGVVGLDALNPNDVVEVHGTPDSANNSILASYVEKKVGVNDYRIQGRVTAIGDNKTFSMGSLQLNYSNTESKEVRVTPAQGALVRVRLGTTAVSGVYPVIRIRKPEDAFNAFSGEVEFKGTITAFTSFTSFTVNDVPVTVSGVTNSTYPEGTGRIEAGAYVEVKGALVGGVLVATRVKLEDVPAGNAGGEFELHGTISNPATSGAGGSFTLTSSSGVSVEVEWSSAPSSVTFRDGSAANLTNARKVEVKGTLLNGNKVKATRISFES